MKLRIFLFHYFLLLIPVSKTIAQDANLEWARQMGGPAASIISQAVSIDNSGNVYTAGYFEGSVDFDPGAGTKILTSAGSKDLFVQKYDISGNLVWVVQAGSTELDHAYAITTDASGFIYVAGSFQLTVDFNPGPGVENLTSSGLSRSCFIQKLDAAGNLVWVKQMGGAAGTGEAVAIVTDGSNLYSTGNFGGTVDFDPGTGVTNLTSAGNHDCFIQKLDINGNFIWAKQAGGTTGDEGMSIAVDIQGNVYTAGWFQGTGDYDPGTGTEYLTSAGAWDIFIQKLNASGNLIWAKRVGSPIDDEPTSIALDGSSNVYLTGYFGGTIDFDPGTGVSNFTSAGLLDNFVQKLDADGNFIWAKQMKGSSGTSICAAFSITLDGLGNIYTAGQFNSTVDFDPDTGIKSLTSAGGYDMFIQKLSNSGDLIWVTQIGGVSNEVGLAKLDASKKIYATGYMEGTADFNPETGISNLTTIGTRDAFVLKLDQNTAPSDISLSSNSIDENNSVNAIIGTITTTDINSSDTHTYSLVSGAGSNDNANFTIDGSQLRAGITFDYETKNTFSIRLQTVDGHGGTFQKQFTISIGNVSANQTITFNSLASKTYGSTPFTVSATSTSTLLVSYASNNTSVATVLGNTITIVGAGEAKITASQAGNSDYNPATNVEQTFIVTKAPLTLTANSISRLYGAVNPALTISYSGFINGDDANNITAPSISTAATISSNAGAYLISLSGGTATNYEMALQNGTLTISKVPLTATANSFSRSYGSVNPALTVNYSGFVNGDNVNQITVPALTTTATTTSNVGIYPITLSGGSAANYNLILQQGILTITKASQSITFSSLATKSMGDPPFTLTATASSGLGIIFSSTNTSVATITGNTITIVGSGSAIITAVQPGDNNFDQAQPVEKVLTVSENPITGIEYSTLSESPLLFPNPAYDKISVTLTQFKIDHDVTILIIDNYGRTLQKLKASGEKVTLYISNLAEGFYYVRVVQGSRIRLGRFSKL